VLGDLETKKLYMFLGCSLEKHEAVMADGDSNDHVLECASPPENGDWIRRCGILPGEKSLGAIALVGWDESWEKKCCT
jgi:hypothetical protein